MFLRPVRQTYGGQAVADSAEVRQWRTKAGSGCEGWMAEHKEHDLERKMK
jgi:hypothetical protein